MSSIVFSNNSSFCYVQIPNEILFIDLFDNNEEKRIKHLQAKLDWIEKLCKDGEGTHEFVGIDGAFAIMRNLIR